MLWSSLPTFALSTAECDSISQRYTLDEVSVVATHYEPAILPAQQLQGDELQKLSTLSVADALRYFSGVQMKDYGGVGGFKSIDIRSMGSHHVGVFYDGIEVGNAQNGIVDLGKFSLDNIESISLYNGQKTTLLQPAKDYGSAGTLYIRTRRPVFSPGKNYNVEISMKAGSFGLANPSLLYEQRLSDHVHLSANAEYMFATGRYHFRIRQMYPNGSVAWDTTGIRQNGDIQAFRAEVGLFGYFPQGKWHVKGYYYQSERGIPRALIRNVWTSSQRQWDRNAFCQASVQYRPFQRWEMLFSAKYSNDRMRYLNPDTTLMYIDHTFLQQEAYMSWANQVTLFPWWNLSLSADYIFSTLRSDMPNFVFPHRHTELVAAATSFHYRWIRAQASVLGTFVQDVLQRPSTLMQQAAEQTSRFTPAVFLSYQPLLSEQLYLRTFYKQIFRLPTFNDLYYTDMGNTALRPEETSQYDLGVEYSKQFIIGHSPCQWISLHAKADGYFNQVKNKILAVPKGNSQYRWMMMNIGYVEIFGADINTGLKFAFDRDWQLDLTATYTYQRAKDLTDPTDPITYGGQIAYIPRHSCSALANLSWRGLSLNYSFIYVGERYHASANIPANYCLPWYTHDLSVGYLFDFQTWKLSTTVELNNLLNQQYDIILNYPMPGFNGKLILKFLI